MGKSKRIFKGVGLVRQSVKKLQSNTAQRIHLERVIKEFSKQDNRTYEFIDFFEEEKSGRKDKFHLRESFQKIERMVARKEVDFVMFESVSRMGRWDVKNKEFVQLAHENGILIFFADGGRLDLRNKQDRIKFGLDSLFAEEGSNEISERVKKKGRINAVVYGKDKNTTPTLGLAPHKTYTGQYIRSERGIKIVDKMVNNFLKTKNYAKTAEFLNECGHRTPNRYTKESVNSSGERVLSRKIGGEKFTASSIRRYLTDKKLRGWNEFLDEYDQYPELQNDTGMVKWQYGYAREDGPIISEEKAKLIDKIIDARKHKRQKLCKHLLSDILESPEGIKYRGSGGTSRNGEPHKYYEIPKRHRKKEGSYRTLPAKILEPLILNRVKSYLKDSKLLSEVISKFIDNRHLGIAPLKEQVIELEQEVKELKRKVEKYTQKIEALILDDDFDRESIKTLTEMKVKVEDKLILKSKALKDIQERLHQMCNTGREKAFKDTLKNILKMFETAELPRRRELLQMVFPKIVVFPDGALHLELNLALESLHMEKNGAGTRKKWLGWPDSNRRPTD